MNNKQNDEDSKFYELYFFENPITKNSNHYLLLKYLILFKFKIK